MSTERDPNYDQPLPVGNDSTPIHTLVQADLAARLEMGTKKYGQPLQAHNGRNALLDAYEEALDLCVYLKQALVEAERPPYPDCDWHIEVQHRDRKAPWCERCGWHRGRVIEPFQGRTITP